MSVPFQFPGIQEIGVLDLIYCATYPYHSKCNKKNRRCVSISGVKRFIISLKVTLLHPFNEAQIFPDIGVTVCRFPRHLVFMCDPSQLPRVLHIGESRKPVAQTGELIIYKTVQESTFALYCGHMPKYVEPPKRLSFSVFALLSNKPCFAKNPCNSMIIQWLRVHIRVLNSCISFLYRRDFSKKNFPRNYGKITAIEVYLCEL